MMSKLTVGEDYLSSDLFDSWRYTGLSLASDESQLPPNFAATRLKSPVSLAPTPK
jgi:outer membrane usher protein FimD/PapC